jgi:hypothetical protein
MSGQHLAGFHVQAGSSTMARIPTERIEPRLTPQGFLSETNDPPGGLRPIVRAKDPVLPSGDGRAGTDFRRVRQGNLITHLGDKPSVETCA